jgi:zinc protease
VEHRALQLDNGLRVVLAPRPGPLAMVWVRYHVGAADDPPEHRGLAHLVEHLLFTGSKHTYGADAADQLYQARALGANGATAMRTTDYYATVPRANLERVLWLESDRMGFMRGEVTRAEIKLAREVVGTELRILHNDEHARLFGRVHNAVYPLPHPCFDPEDAGTLIKVDVAVVEAFLGKYVVPANAQIVVAGDLPGDVESLVQRYFGDLRGGAAPVRKVLPPSPLSGEVRLRDAAGRALIKIGWPSPAQWSAEDAAADVAATLLVHNAGGRLWAEDGPVARLEAQQVSRAGGSLFVVQALGRSGARADEVLVAVDAAVRAVTNCSDSELTVARQLLKLELVNEGEELAGMVGLVHSHLDGFGRADGLAAALQRYEEIDGARALKFVEGTLIAGPRAVLSAEPGGAA